MNALEKKLAGYVAGHQDIVIAYLFGSQVTGKARRESDVDVALLFGMDEVPGTDHILQIEDELTSLFRREVDVVILNDASPIIRMQVLRKGRKIFERNHQATIDFFVRTIKEYDDLKRVRSVNEKNILNGRIYG